MVNTTYYHCDLVWMIMFKRIEMDHFVSFEVNTMDKCIELECNVALGELKTINNTCCKNYQIWLIMKIAALQRLEFAVFARAQYNQINGNTELANIMYKYADECKGQVKLYEGFRR